jgi:hypothetical protein
VHLQIIRKMMKIGKLSIAELAKGLYPFYRELKKGGRVRSVLAGRDVPGRRYL